MIKLIKDDEFSVQISNGVIMLEFNKSGKKQGLYSLHLEYPEKENIKLTDCYSSINFENPISDKLIEKSSKQYTFDYSMEDFEDEFGKGSKFLFIPKITTDQVVFFNILFTLYDESDFLLVQIINIEDKSQDQWPIHSISPLTIRDQNLWLSGKNLPSDLYKTTWFKNGWQSWSPCFVIPGNQKDKKRPPLKMARRVLDNQDYGIKGRFYSEYCTAITDLQTRNSLILGFVTLKEQFSRIIFDYSSSKKFKLLTAFGCMDGVKFSKSSITSSEELFISFKLSNLGYYGLLEYAKQVKNRIQEIRITDVPVGWCSWYYYFTEITQREMLKNLDFFKAHQNDLPIDFIQLDDGYQAEIGDYDKTNETFSDGLTSLFRKIKRSGFNGGIWTGPFFAKKKAKVFENHPDWFLKKKGSNRFLKATFNWGNFLHALDLTKLEVLDHLKTLFGKLLLALNDDSSSEIEEPLISFFKIDFLHASAPYDGDFSDQSLTRAQLYYNGIKAVREGIGEDSFLLGCGAPLGPCVGLVDAMRIGTDTAPTWKILDKIGERFGFSVPSLKRALLPVLYRSFMHRYFWINDPDCLMTRRTDTKLKLNEIRLQLTIFGLSGGQLLISDDMTKLAKEEIEDIKLLIPPYNSDEFDPIPTDIFYSEYPSIYMLETFEDIGKRFLVALINWKDKPKDAIYAIDDLIPKLLEDEQEFLIFDFWNKKYLGTFRRNDLIKLAPIEPHSCHYLSIIPITEELKQEPILLSSNLHITQGCNEITEFEYDADDHTLAITIDLIGERKGSFFLKLPENEAIKECALECNLLNEEENIWELKTEFKDSSSMEIKLG